MKTPNPKRGLAGLLQVVIVGVGLAALGFLLWEPHLEGRNAQSTVYQIYFNDPFLVYVYAGSIPFFVALYRSFGLLSDIRQNGAISPRTLRSLRSIKRCALTIIGFVGGGVIIILLHGDGDDRPAGIFMSFLVAGGASVIAIVSTLLARNLQAKLAHGAEESSVTS